MKRYILILAAALSLASCNDDFLEKKPLNELVEETAFQTSANFQSYAWSFYDVFWNDTNFLRSYQVTDGRSQNALGDIYSGYLSKSFDLESKSNPFRAGTMVVPQSGGGWDYTSIRKVNLMLDNIETSSMTDAQKKHWEGIGRFFRAYSYAELSERFGDVIWIDYAPADDDDIIYSKRTPRAEVADHIVADLEFAVANIDDKLTGGNTITRNAARALLSRYTLFEGTWRKYHGLGDEDKMLDLCIKYSAELMASYPKISNNYDGLYNTDDLSTREGMIFHKEFTDGLIMHQTCINQYEVPQRTIDWYLCQDGKPISTSPMYDGDYSMYDAFRNRDKRLLLTVIPPYAVQYSVKGVTPYPDYTSNGNHNKTALYFGKTYKGGVEYDPTTDPAYSNSIDGVAPVLAANREYMDLMSGPEFSFLQPWTKQNFPIMNWSGTNNATSSPNITGIGQGVPLFYSGYGLWRVYNVWDKMSNMGTIQVTDRPIFWIEEIMLNYAEAMWERGLFTQDIADQTINRLRERAGVADMIVANINDSWDPNRDQTVDPVLWEIRRERQIELMAEGFGWQDIRRWKKGPWYMNGIQKGVYISDINDFKIYNAKSGEYEVNKNWAKLKLIDKNDKLLGTLNYTDNVGGGNILRFEDPAANGGGWDDKYYLWPIPTEDLLLSQDNLVQNPGWEEE